MNVKQKRFADYYLIDLNASKAAVKAGYSNKNPDQIGWQLLQKPTVIEYIKQKTQTIADKLGIDTGYVLGSFKKVADRSLEAEPVLDKEGNPIGDYVFNAAGANKALEMLGKHLRLFGDDDKKQDTNVTINIVQF